MTKVLFIIIPAIALVAYVVACVLAAAFPFSDAGLELDFLLSGEAFFPSALAIYLIIATVAHAALGWPPARSGLVALAIAGAWALVVYMGAIGRAITGAGGGHPGSPGALEDAFFLPERLVVKPIEALTAPLRRRSCVRALAGPYRLPAQEELCRMGVPSLSAGAQLAMIQRLQQDASALATKASPAAAELDASGRLRRCLLEVHLEAPEVLRHLTSTAADPGLDEQAREDAIGMLGRAGVWKAELLSTLLALASEDRSPAIRRAALEAAFEIAPGDAHLEPACLAAVERGDAAGALGLHYLDPDDRRVARAYASRLRSDDAAVRLAWLRTLLRAPGGAADGLAVTTKDGRTRRLQETLAESPPADLDLRRALQDAVTSPDAAVACAAARATVEIFPQPGNARLLTRLLRHATPQVREEAASLVVSCAPTCADDALFDALFEALAASDSKAVRQAVGILLRRDRPADGEQRWRLGAAQLARVVSLAARTPGLWKELGYDIETAAIAFREAPASALEEALVEALAAPAVAPGDARFAQAMRLRAGLVATTRGLGHRQDRLQLALAEQIGFGTSDASEPGYEVANLRDDASRALTQLRPYSTRTVARLEALAASRDKDVAQQARRALESGGP